MGGKAAPGIRVMVAGCLWWESEVESAAAVLSIIDPSFVWRPESTSHGVPYPIGIPIIDHNNIFTKDKVSYHL